MLVKNSVGKRSEKALGLLNSIVLELVYANDEAEDVIAEQQKRIDALLSSNDELLERRRGNNVVIKNIEKLIGVKQ